VQSYGRERFTFFTHKQFCMWRSVYYTCPSTNYAISSLKINIIKVYMYKTQARFHFTKSIHIFKPLEGANFCSAYDIVKQISLVSNNVDRTFISANNKILLKESNWSVEINFMSS
jgi:hypothetical protein